MTDRDKTVLKNIITNLEIYLAALENIKEKDATEECERAFMQIDEARSSMWSAINHRNNTAAPEGDGKPFDGRQFRQMSGS